MSRDALLVMDVQQAIVERFAGVESAVGYLPRLRSTIEAARAADVPVIYVVVGFRAGHPEVSGRNKTFSALVQSGAFAEGTAGTAVHPEVAPQPGDIVVTKKRVSAFAGSDLDMVLRANQVGGLVLTGIATSGVVLSTVRQAADLDFRLTVLADGCLDADAEVHRVLVEKVFPRQAEVVGSEEWVKGL
ncbi:cysteine hydrolase [Actinospica durhamensis]|uniref:Cysteine hydrolase n=1 Tax=Actinospica durhamensis TaxID=1508375 RepID=A0A941IRW6_9ACTN|nr:isochorismatase family cysteine hydrolase [Actinospica durhamensis]MBR7839265.1 cysteine hydrolase [Actinospica durhamensis]